MNIELKDKNGITLKTAGKYCSSDVGIIPKLQSKSVVTNGSVVADEGYCGLDSVTVDVPATPTQEKTVDLAMAYQKLLLKNPQLWLRVISKRAFLSVV